MRSRLGHGIGLVLVGEQLHLAAQERSGVVRLGDPEPLAPDHLDVEAAVVVRLDLGELDESADPVGGLHAVVADLVALPDRDDPEDPVEDGLDADQLADQRAVALLEDVQRGDHAREHHRVEREQWHLGHATNLVRVVGRHRKPVPGRGDAGLACRREQRGARGHRRSPGQAPPQQRRRPRRGAHTVRRGPARAHGGGRGRPVRGLAEVRLPLLPGPRPAAPGGAGPADAGGRAALPPRGPRRGAARGAHRAVRRPPARPLRPDRAHGQGRAVHRVQHAGHRRTSYAGGAASSPTRPPRTSLRSSRPWATTGPPTSSSPSTCSASSSHWRRCASSGGLSPERTRAGAGEGSARAARRASCLDRSRRTGPPSRWRRAGSVCSDSMTAKTSGTCGLSRVHLPVSPRGRHRPTPRHGPRDLVPAAGRRGRRCRRAG